MMKRLLVHRDPEHPDMSPEAIEARLREMAQLYKLGMDLKSPTWVWRGNLTETAARQKGSIGATINEPVPR